MSVVGSTPKRTSLNLELDMCDHIDRLAASEDRSHSYVANQLLRAALTKAAEDRKRANLNEFARAVELGSCDPAADESRPIGLDLRVLVMEPAILLK